jgi:hypothetical protein
VGKWKHKLTGINVGNKTAFCANCGPVKIKRKASPNGWRCKKAENKFTHQCTRRKKRSYRKHLGRTCERCGFLPEHKCQMDIHHLDNEHTNDAPDNLQTLCANCHRYITELHRAS